MFRYLVQFFKPCQSCPFGVPNLVFRGWIKNQMRYSESGTPETIDSILSSIFQNKSTLPILGPNQGPINTLCSTHSKSVTQTTRVSIPCSVFQAKSILPIWGLKFVFLGPNRSSIKNQMLYSESRTHETFVLIHFVQLFRSNHFCPFFTQIKTRLKIRCKIQNQSRNSYFDILFNTLPFEVLKFVVRSSSLLWEEDKSRPKKN